MRMKPNREKVAEGVPLPMIIKREMTVSPDLVMLSQPESVYAERFRRLTSRLAHKHGDTLQVIVVTSSIPGEGKSTVSANLALAFATVPGSRVLLVDADLRRPTIGNRLDPLPQLGVTEVVSGRAELPHAIVHLRNTPLHVLPAGERPPDPHQLLTSPEAKELVVELRERYDRVIIDTPPVIPFTDADTLGAMSDGVVIVARVGTTPRSALAQGVAAVTSTRILGTVLNGMERNLADRSSYHDDYYGSYYDKKRRER